tara:strand:+ start:2747 stop:2974 length:228 start_codon:yes stop_codon:yes gene_type:complete
MADIKVRVGQTPAVKVTSNLGGSSVVSLNDLTDVNLGTASAGTLLVYNSSSKKFEGTNTLSTGNDQNLTIDGGVF